MNKKKLLICILACSTAFLAQAETISIAVNTDAWIRSDDPGKPNGLGDGNLAGDFGSGGESKTAIALMSFNLSDPALAGATINSISLTLQKGFTGNSADISFTTNVYELLVPFDHETTNWGVSSAGAFWGGASDFLDTGPVDGVDYDAAAVLASYTGNESTTPVGTILDFSPNSALSDAVAANIGGVLYLMFTSPADDQNRIVWNYTSSERAASGNLLDDSAVPQFATLTIDYTPEPVGQIMTIPVDTDAWIRSDNPGQPNGFGGGNLAGDFGSGGESKTAIALMSFDLTKLALAGATINSVSLTVQKGAEGNSADVTFTTNVYGLFVPFDDATTNWGVSSAGNFWGGASEFLDTGPVDGVDYDAATVLASYVGNESTTELGTILDFSENSALAEAIEANIGGKLYLMFTSPADDQNRVVWNYTSTEKAAAGAPMDNDAIPVPPTLTIDYTMTEGWIFTDWLGWLYVGPEAWVYSLSLEQYIYIPNYTGWVYIPKP